MSVFHEKESKNADDMVGFFGKFEHVITVGFTQVIVKQNK